MQLSDQHLLKILTLAIHNQELSYEIYGINWEEVYKTVSDHEISLLVFSQIKHIELKPPIEMLEDWKRQVLISVIRIENMIDNAEFAIKVLVENGVEVFAIKGLFLRHLYLDPLQRSMCDTDILIHRKDFSEATRVLNNNGYVNENYNENVTSFSKSPYGRIELHSKMITLEKYVYADSLDNFWENALIDQKVSKYAKVLSKEDCYIYNIVHIAKHLNYRGHGLRQLCDVVLLTEKYIDELDWEQLQIRFKDIELKKLTDIIFVMCHKYLEMKIPSKWIFGNLYLEEIADELIEFILQCGVLGFRDRKMPKVFDIRSQQKNSVVKSRHFALLTILTKTIFPRYEDLEKSYKYLQKHPILLPYAYFERMKKYVKNKNNYDKILIDTINSVSDVEKENKLLNDLGINHLFSFSSPKRKHM